MKNYAFPFISVTHKITRETGQILTLINYIRKSILLKIYVNAVKGSYKNQMNKSMLNEKSYLELSPQTSRKIIIKMIVGR